ncbi:MAG TPA: amino acid ABC transporter permease [Candidatus Avichristensenella intestinipullorum]|uniref:Amino acid ABC transporter permease n=1 Tax=Candidatus Avichristensenella intestinipullorum TaxID=2840693 RepID=A0A9D1CII6_9FIRM|nr:amino acid ABC transporter permease [Candidatus Avichristensenella intestinipullorum]
MLDFFSGEQFRTVVSALNSGFLVTLRLFFVTLVGALPLGLLISFGSMSRWAPLARPVRWGLRRTGRAPGRMARFCLRFCPVSLVCRLLVWLVRGTPLVLQIITLFYVPGMLGLFTWGGGERARFTAVSVAFILNYAFYFSEIYRGGIQGVPEGQREAGQVLGMTRSQIFFKVTLLQMVKRIVPPMSNEIITLVKDTSLARVIALQEVIWMGESFMKGNKGLSGLVWPLFFTAVYYLVFSGVVTLCLGWLEKKLAYFR